MLPKIWRRALVVAILKPKKPIKDPKSYRPISLLCIPFKILARFIYTRIEPIVDPLLPREQADFRHERSTVDQVTLVIQEIEESFSANRKADAVLVDLTAACDTVWHRGLTCKLLQLLPDRHMVSLIMELVRNCSFTLTTGERCSSEISPGFSPIQHLHTRSPSNRRKICLCRRSGYFALSKKLAHVGRGFNPRYVYHIYPLTSKS